MAQVTIRTSTQAKPATVEASQQTLRSFYATGIPFRLNYGAGKPCYGTFTSR